MTHVKRGSRYSVKRLNILCFLARKRPVLYLTEMNARFTEIRSVDSPEPDSYRSWKLKEKLKGYFKDRLIFISQSGTSDL